MSCCVSDVGIDPGVARNILSSSEVIDFGIYTSIEYSGMFLKRDTGGTEELVVPDFAKAHASATAKQQVERDVDISRIEIEIAAANKLAAEQKNCLLYTSDAADE